MTDIEVRIQTRYEYWSGDESPCVAIVRIELPMNDYNNALWPVLRSARAEDCVLGERPEAYWGVVVEEHHARAREMKVTGADWQTVAELAREMRDEALETIKAIVERNERMMATIPRTEEVVVCIPATIPEED